MPTLLEQFHHNCTTYADATCWRYKTQGEWHTLSWRDVEAKVTRLASWFIAQGLQPGDRVCIWSSTRWEWSLGDLAVLAAGGVVVPVYQTLPVDQGSFIVSEPKCRFLLLERVYSQEFIAALESACPDLVGILVMEPGETGGKLPVWQLQDVLHNTSASMEAYGARWQQRDENDLASIVYTSGTTGTPKGVELTLKNFRHEVAALSEVFPFPAGTELLEFLPLAHIVARAAQFFQIWLGLTGSYAESIDALGDNISEVRPHFFVGVPRVFEKIQARVQANVATMPAFKQKLFAWALDVGSEVSRTVRAGRSPSLGLRVRHAVARKIFAPVRQRMGGRLEKALSGGAPLAKEVAEFFHSLGVLIIEGYGLTETTAALTINRSNNFRFGSVGQALDGIQLRIAPDGEILAKGPTIFRGYYQRPDATAEVLEADGWFHTGDIGELSADGFLRITDRKKDLIKTSGGKYIAPQVIENRLKLSHYISDAVVQGDRRKYLTALVTLDPPAVEQFAKTHGIAYQTWKDLVREPKVVEMVQQAVNSANDGLASFETVKRFHILDHQFAIESGELTPTMKVKRNIAYEHYKELFDQMYADA